jgi:hypothetical protein
MVELEPEKNMKKLSDEVTKEQLVADFMVVLETVAVILLVLWLLGIVSPYMPWTGSYTFSWPW